MPPRRRAEPAERSPTDVAAPPRFGPWVQRPRGSTLLPRLDRASGHYRASPIRSAWDPGCDDSRMPGHWLKAVGHARGPLPARWVEEGRTSVLREGGFPRRPRVHEDDRLVLYASVWRRVFGVVVAVGEPYQVEHPRWPWRIAVEPLLVIPDLDLAP